jgi:uncharacterized protein YacL (UPF0231 family)
MMSEKHNATYHGDESAVARARILDAVGMIDVTMSANEETTTRWRNDEVMAMLSNLRTVLTEDTLI